MASGKGRFDRRQRALVGVTEDRRHLRWLDVVGPRHLGSITVGLDADGGGVALDGNAVDDRVSDGACVIVPRQQPLAYLHAEHADDAIVTFHPEGLDAGKELVHFTETAPLGPYLVGCGGHRHVNCACCHVLLLASLTGCFLDRIICSVPQVRYCRPHTPASGRPHGGSSIMDTRSIGSLTVGVVGLGCNNFGMRIGRKETASVVGAALDFGITLFHTADIYGVPYEGHEGGASPAYIRTAVEDSLQRLGTDRIDLYQQHLPDPKTPIADTV